MKYRAHVICEKCGLEYLTIKLKQPKPVKCKKCKSNKIKTLQSWVVEKTPTFYTLTDALQLTESELRQMLPIGYKGKEYLNLLYAYGTKVATHNPKKGNQIQTYARTLLSKKRIKKQPKLPRGRPKGSTKRKKVIKNE